MFDIIWNYLQRDGKPYCRNDYFDMFAPKCVGCNRAIMENYISALNAQWHADCFVCRVSYTLLLKDILIWNDHMTKETENISKWILVWHNDVIFRFDNIWLFDIQDCKKPVSGKSFYAMEGKPVCPPCVGVEADD